MAIPHDFFIFYEFQRVALQRQTDQLRQNPNLPLKQCNVQGIFAGVISLWNDLFSRARVENLSRATFENPREVYTVMTSYLTCNYKVTATSFFLIPKQNKKQQYIYAGKFIIEALGNVSYITSL